MNSPLSLWLSNESSQAVLLPYFNSNPETGTSLATFWVYQCDDESVPIPGAKQWRIDYDYKTNKTSRFWSSCCECQRETITQVLMESRDAFATQHRLEMNQAKAKLRQMILAPDLRNGSIVAYHDFLPGCDSSADVTDHVAGTMFLHDSCRWWVTDMYCASPKCPCDETLLIFHKVDGCDMVEDVFIVDY